MRIHLSHRAEQQELARQRRVTDLHLQHLQVRQSEDLRYSARSDHGLQAGEIQGLPLNGEQWGVRYRWLPLAQQVSEGQIPRLLKLPRLYLGRRLRYSFYPLGDINIPLGEMQWLSDKRGNDGKDTCREDLGRTYCSPG